MSDAAWQIHCDGTALPNPGVIAVGAVLVSPSGERHELSRKMGRRGCCNEAELLAFIESLRLAAVLGATHLHVFSDSSIAVERIVGQKVTSVARLSVLVDEARALAAQFRDVRVQWVPRHRNTEADALARAAQGLRP